MLGSSGNYLLARQISSRSRSPWFSLGQESMLGGESIESKEEEEAEEEEEEEEEEDDDE